MGRPAARVTDMHTCPMVNPGPVPHVGGPILPPCKINVLTGGLPQARVTDLALCVGPPDIIAQGSPTVLCGGLPAARMGDSTVHGGVIVAGCFTVLIGDGGAQGGGAAGAAGAATGSFTGPNPAGWLAMAAGIGLALRYLYDRLTSGHLTSDQIAKSSSPLAKSPKFLGQLKQLEGEGWQVEFGKAGEGSYCDKTAKSIIIDPNDKHNPNALAQTLSHELGHAFYRESVVMTSRSEYVRSNLADEGAATLNNITVQREIIKGGGPDIGIAGNASNHARYNQIFNEYEVDGNAVKARDEIGGVFGKGERTSTTNELYEDYYGNWYDKNI